MENLVIVESPAKAKTIEKFLGPDYKVMSSYGHIRDLKKKDFSIDVDSQFAPIYEVPAEKKELVAQLKKAASQASMVWLASDEDREGEAIAWHLYEVLRLKPENTRRIVFHEITKPAILHAIEHPREIDINLVNAQQARRVLDRIVGFELSPVLWKKIKPSLSAGRVQSVAVRLICEREKEIRAFATESFFRLSGFFQSADGIPFKGEMGRKVATKEEALRILEESRGAAYTVKDLSVKPLTRSPQPPFTTSTLQQEAARRLGFSVSQTMMVAQKLYEAGHITYMRTDSLNLSKISLGEIAENIKSTYGEDYLHTRQYHTKSKGAQEAHEAIRPTYIGHAAIDGTAQEQRLYSLIRQRTLASQMADAKLEKTTVDIQPEAPQAGSLLAGVEYRAEGETVKFPGFLKVYETSALHADDEILPPLAVGMTLTADSITATQRFTQAPPRFNEASLVKKMEELGIGRPSTYAPTISTIQGRDYVVKGESEGTPRKYEMITLEKGAISEKTLSEKTGGDKGRLVPTDTGMVVNDFLSQYFPNILDYNFTAKVEEKFDDISEGKLAWGKEIEDFYTGFHPGIKEVSEMRMEHKVGERCLGTHPQTGRPVYVKIGRFGPVVQIGEATDTEKPLFASLQKGQSISSITLEEALKLFELPRHVGEFEGKDVVAAVGRFGPYIRFDKLFVSIPKTLTPQGITLEEAVALIEKKREEEANKLIKDFSAEMPGLQVLRGRFGPYLAYKPEGAKKAVNYKIPKTSDPEALTFAEAQKLMEAQDSSKATGVKAPRGAKTAAKTTKRTAKK